MTATVTYTERRTLPYRHFGEVDIDAASRAMTVRLRDQQGAELWSTVLSP
jgi:hypothetical protein